MERFGKCKGYFAELSKSTIATEKYWRRECYIIKRYNSSSSNSEFVLIPYRVEVIGVRPNIVYVDRVGGWRSCLAVVWHSENTGFSLGCVFIKDHWGGVMERKGRSCEHATSSPSYPWPCHCVRSTFCIYSTNWLEQRLQQELRLNWSLAHFYV